MDAGETLDRVLDRDAGIRELADYYSTWPRRDRALLIVLLRRGIEQDDRAQRSDKERP